MVAGMVTAGTVSAHTPLEHVGYRYGFLQSPKAHRTPYACDHGERGGSLVECRTPEREVGGSKPTAAVLCPRARHFTPRKYWLITQEAVAPSRND